MRNTPAEDSSWWKGTISSPLAVLINLPCEDETFSHFELKFFSQKRKSPKANANAKDLESQKANAKVLETQKANAKVLETQKANVEVKLEKHENCSSSRWSTSKQSQAQPSPKLGGIFDRGGSGHEIKQGEAMPNLLSAKRCN